jgi:hypothetical protein
LWRMTHYDSSVEQQKCMLVVNVYGGVWYVALYRLHPHFSDPTSPQTCMLVVNACGGVWHMAQTLRSTERTTCSGSSHHNRPIHTRFELDNCNADACIFLLGHLIITPVQASCIAFSAYCEPLGTIDCITTLTGCRHSCSDAHAHALRTLRSYQTEISGRRCLRLSQRDAASLWAKWARFAGRRRTHHMRGCRPSCLE